MDYKSELIRLSYHECNRNLGFTMGVYLVDNFVVKVVDNKNVTYALAPYILWVLNSLTVGLIENTLTKES